MRVKSSGIYKICNFANKQKKKIARPIVPIDTEDGRALFDPLVYSLPSTGLFETIFVVGAFVAFFVVLE